MRIKIFHQILLCSTLVALYFNAATGLEAVHVGKLPYVVQDAVAVYDGQDSVFLIGGEDGQAHSSYDNILKYNLTSNEVEEVGKFPYGITSGAATQSAVGDVYYFGGLNYNSSEPDDGDYVLWKFTNTFSSAQNISLVTNNEAHNNVARFSNDTWYVIGGTLDDGFPSPYISAFDVATETLKWTALLPLAATSVSSAVFGEHVYIFGGNPQAQNGYGHDNIPYITKFTPSTKKVEALNLELIFGIEKSTAITAGEEIYIVGGGRYYWNEPEQHSVSRFTPSTGRVDHINVLNFPLGLRGAATVYIPKTNRIYTFGGVREMWYPFDDVYYIQLGNSEPSV